MSDGIFTVGLSTPRGASKSGGTSNGERIWLTLGDGEQRRVVFFKPQSQMLNYYEHSIWKGTPQNSPRFPCLGRNNGCPGCNELKHKPRWRAVANVLVLDEVSGQHKVMLFSFGPKLKEDVLTVTGILGEDDFAGAILVLSRNGTGIKTKWGLNMTGKNFEGLDSYQEYDPTDFIKPTERQEIIDMVNSMWGESSALAPKTESDDSDTSLAAIAALVED